MSYNGWTNYETWAVALWIDNDEGLQSEANAIGRRNRSDWDCAEALKSLICEMAPDIPASLYSDLLNAALSEVNWREIAAHYKEEEEEEEEGTKP